MFMITALTLIILMIVVMIMFMVTVVFMCKEEETATWVESN